MKIKKLAAGLVAMAVLFVGGGTSVSAASESSSYSLYYNSPASYSITAYCTLPYYGGTQTFQVSTLSGSATSISVIFSGVDVNLKSTIEFTRTGSTTFTCTTKTVGQQTEKFKVYLRRGTNSTEGATAYASGKVSY